ncbi:SnoaL-like domain protein [Pigmentiphaga humi]|uniref:SnoaL-like domain protein n=1 Tax=Pigmentiphaga humi TaxID=2478468 RepID=A0A3P4AXW9_9BURK|nr:nuclear transport factor 2 family protein [Pigmentiphaga humi]VCU68250.1 SnoaL-like domain protein [Pigmentiphaga humi]
MHDFDNAAAVIGCQQTIHRFYAALDASDFDTVAACMTGDGYWPRQGRELRGPEQVRAALADRPIGRTTAHLVQNLVVDVQGPGDAIARFMTLVYRVDLPAAAAGPAPLPAPLSISAHEEHLRRSGDGQWLIAKKSARRIFGG